jgi:hypothetical protein
MLITIASLIAVAYLPGAVIFRLPVADRSKRAALPAEERLFWARTRWLRSRGATSCSRRLLRLDRGGICGWARRPGGQVGGPRFLRG